MRLWTFERLDSEQREAAKEPLIAMRSIATQPGTAARVPIKQDDDARQYREATKVQTPFRRGPVVTLKAKTNGS